MIGNKCVFKDGLGLEKLFHTIQLLKQIKYQLKLFSMQNKGFQRLKID